MEGNLTEDSRLEEAVVEFVRQRDWVSLVELQNYMADYMETKGDMVWELLPCVVIWAGMSEDFALLVADLVEKQRIFLHPADSLTYLIDGGVLQLPVVKRTPKDGYKKNHWLPVCLRTVPMEKEKSRRRCSK